jgi:hypothetical protein
MLRCIFIVAGMAVSGALYAQESLKQNTIALGGNILNLPNHFNQINYRHFDSWRLEYQRLIKGRISVSIGYERLKRWGPNNGAITTQYLNALELRGMQGKRYSSTSFSFADAFASYNLPVGHKQIMRFSQGISLAMYSSEYITQVETWDNFPAPGQYTITTLNMETRNEVSFGGITSASYNYLLFKNRMTLGIEVGARYYYKAPLIIMFGPRAALNF